MTFKEYLVKNHITYRAFAERVNIDAAQLVRYANGQRLPSLKSAYKIYIATKKVVNLQSWFGGTPV
jgi:transcriptional regulator with XRE-family HTH domain